MQRSVLDAGSIQHSIELGEKVNALLASAPLLLVYPLDDYADRPTKTLCLIRTHADVVTTTTEASCMNFSPRPGYTGVDLLLAVDEIVLPRDKTERYLSCFEQVIAKIFAA